jgi:hypothetical protein
VDKLMVEYYTLWGKIYKLIAIRDLLKAMVDRDELEEKTFTSVKRQISTLNKKIRDYEEYYELTK